MGLEISQVGIVGLLQRFTGKALPMYQEIKNRIEKAACLGTDETGAKINGKTHWFWTWQNEALTFIVQSPSRGYKTIQETFPDGLSDVVLVHDRWAAHFKCEVDHHQVCLAHLFRDLNYITQVHGSNWAQSLKSVLKEAIALNNQPDYNGLVASPARSDLEWSLMDLLQHTLPEKDNLAIRLQKNCVRSVTLYFAFYITIMFRPTITVPKGLSETLKLNKRCPEVFGLLMVPMALL